VSPLPTQFQDVLHLLIESAWPNPAVNADVPDTCVLLASRGGGTPVT